MSVRMDALLTAADRAAVVESLSMRKRLWILRRDVHQVEAQIVWRERQWELQLFSGGSLITWRQFAQRSAAVTYADLFQQDFERDGWH